MIPGSKLCPRQELGSTMFSAFMALEDLTAAGLDFPYIPANEIDSMPPQMILSAWQLVYGEWLKLPPHLQKLITVPFPKGSQMASTLMSYTPSMEYQPHMITLD